MTKTTNEILLILFTDLRFTLSTLSIYLHHWVYSGKAFCSEPVMKWSIRVVRLPLSFAVINTDSIKLHRCLNFLKTKRTAINYGGNMKYSPNLFRSDLSFLRNKHAQGSWNALKARLSTSRKNCLDLCCKVLINMGSSPSQNAPSWYLLQLQLLSNPFYLRSSGDSIWK